MVLTLGQRFLSLEQFIQCLEETMMDSLYPCSECFVFFGMCMSAFLSATGKNTIQVTHLDMAFLTYSDCPSLIE